MFASQTTLTFMRESNYVKYQINAKDTIILREARYSSSILSVVILPVVPSSMRPATGTPNSQIPAEYGIYWLPPEQIYPLLSISATWGS